MEIKKINDDISVCSQISLTDVDKIHSLGYLNIICNRPDKELINIYVDQMDKYYEPVSIDYINKHLSIYQNIFSKASSYNLRVFYLPFSFETLSIVHVNSLDRCLKKINKPTLIYCRSGTRSITLWALNEIINNRADINKLLTITKSLGYEIEKVIFDFLANYNNN